MVDPTKPERFIPLAPHSFQILLSLLERDLHGYTLIKDIQERTDGEMLLGTSTVYAAVKRLLHDGLLEEAPGPGPGASKGPRRRVYRITEFGREVARAEGRRIRRVQRMVEETSLLEGHPRPLGQEGKP